MSMARASFKACKFSSQILEFAPLNTSNFAQPQIGVHRGQKRLLKMRKKMGEVLAKKSKVKADFVVPVPDSGVPAALGYANESKIPFELAITRNHYVGRTFIEPSQEMRNLKVKLKLNPMSSVLAGKSIVVIDDSIVRGSTSKRWSIS